MTWEREFVLRRLPKAFAYHLTRILTKLQLFIRVSNNEILQCVSVAATGDWNIGPGRINSERYSR